MHPETTSDPQVLLWRLPAGTLPDAPAVVRAVPEPLAAWLADGRVAELRTDPHGLLVRLADGRSWRADGVPFRTALAGALGRSGEWAFGATDDVDDTALRALAQEVLDVEIAPLASSHGGRIELVGVSEGEVRVSLHGACHGCAASETTLRERFEQALREREPRARVRAVGGPVTISLASILRR